MIIKYSMSSIKIVPKKSKTQAKETGSKKKIEEEYKKYTHKQHILELPDTYVGSIEKTIENIWVLNNKKTSIERQLTPIIPALYKIFDEILVNAFDHYVRSKIKQKTAPDTLLVKNIKVDINKETGTISVYNDGEGIPVEVHSGENIYLPELIFGNLLTSSNYNKDEKKITGGKNGYGAKLTNIYSTEFTIETMDRINKKKYKQTFTDNMNNIGKPQISSCSNKKGYTTISFIPDLKRFGMKSLNKEILNLIERRTYDIASCTDSNVNVFFNDEKIKYNSFEKYVDLFIGSKSESERTFEVCNERWEVGATISPSETFEHVSFVNGISTTKGGKHVDYICNQIVNKLAEFIKKKKGADVKKNYIKENLILFVKSTIENPSFDSQTKENMTTPQSKFGSECKISDKFITKLSKCGIVERVMSLNSLKDNKALSKSDGKKKNTIHVPKLDDANFAGTKKSKDCTLILTEGDSAKTMAVSGLSVVGRDKYGVFPLKGKFLNVKDAPVQKIMDNDELNNIKKIIGLQSGKEYNTEKDLDELRYGKIMLMTDQDHDGFHIKGLIFNLFHSLWPSILKTNKFVSSMLTPIVKVTKGNNVLSFYNETDYLHWKKENNDGKGWKIKYYKGLGTSNSNEAKEYFKKMHVVDYIWNETSDESIDLAFNKSRADDRKTWLGNFSEEQVLDTKETQVGFDDFIHGELIQFSHTDLHRSLPNMVDGLKESQRKVLFGGFKRNLTNEIRVAQFGGYVSEHAAYHHGEASLYSTIINMAQQYTGSNNINLLVPSGQFGTRLMGGKDAASPRYIHTYLSNITRDIFIEKDEPILTYINDDGVVVEPHYYVPIIPMILVNGSIGIGTGFSTNIPCFNPTDIIKQLRIKLSGGEMNHIVPWYQNFKGSIIKTSDKCYMTKGIYKKISSNKLEITELPIGTWSDDYRAFLDSLLNDNNDSANKKTKKPLSGMIKGYQNHCTETEVLISIDFIPGVLDKWESDTTDYGHMNKIEKELKLTTTKYTNMSNMYLFDENRQIKKYADELDIIEEFCQIRLKTYETRRLYQLEDLKRRLDIISSKYRFILEFINDDLIIIKRKKADLYEDLMKRKYPKYSSDMTLISDDTDDNNMIYYNYLIKMPIDSMTEEKLEDLAKEKDNIISQIEHLNNITNTEMWLKELDDFEQKYLSNNDSKKNLKKSLL